MPCRRPPGAARRRTGPQPRPVARRARRDAARRGHGCRRNPPADRRARATPPSSPGLRRTASSTRSCGWTCRAASRPSSPRSCGAFPGFDDQAAFPTKLNEALDLLVKRASGDKHELPGRHRSRGSVGQLSVSVGPLPGHRRRERDARPRARKRHGRPPRRRPGPDRLLAEAGATIDHRDLRRRDDHDGRPARWRSRRRRLDRRLRGSRPGDGARRRRPRSRPPSTRRARPGLATNAQFKTASASVSGDRLGFAYVDIAAVAKGAAGAGRERRASAMPQLPAVARRPRGPVDRGRDPRRRTARSSSTPGCRTSAKIGPAKTAESKLPSVAAAVHRGARRRATTSARRCSSSRRWSPRTRSSRTASSRSTTPSTFVGGFGAIVDWMGEAGIAITRNGDSARRRPRGRHRPTGRPRIGCSPSCAAFVELAGASLRDQAHRRGVRGRDDHDREPRQPRGARRWGRRWRLGGALEDIKIAYSVTDQVVVLGSGTDFVKAVLDARTGDSLAKSARFSAALAAGRQGPRLAAVARCRGRPRPRWRHRSPPPIAASLRGQRQAVPRRVRRRDRHLHAGRHARPWHPRHPRHRSVTRTQPSKRPGSRPGARPMEEHRTRCPSASA